MKTSSVRLGALFAGAIAASVAFGPATASAQKAVTIGSSSIGSTFYVISVAMSKMIVKYAGMNATVQPLGGSYPNLFGLEAGKVDFAMANSLSQYDSYLGKTPFKKPNDVRIVAQGQPNFRTLVVRTKSGARTAEDLVGRTVVAKRRALPELEIIADAFIKVYGLPKDKVKLVSTVNTGQVVKALRAGTVDAAFYPVGPKQPAMSAMYHDGIGHFFPFTKEKRDAMLELLPPAFWGGAFKAGSFPGQKEDAHMFGLNTSFVTNAKMGEDAVYKVTKAILGHPKEFSTFHAAARQWTPQRSLSNASIPFHPGAIRYYKEIGAWTAAHDKQQAELLNR
ncbi:MAG: TAXI family TRAP transporter solute-binding subunit [Alphaproteobacteria bacterium]|nr:TAXI family TRAP transporter solute-binding subunit [Alphaproteobacteria bacterium]